MSGDNLLRNDMYENMYNITKKIEERIMELEESGLTEAGKSAYEVAKEEGFEGTASEWLGSLRGPRGPQGEQGPQGEVGNLIQVEGAFTEEEKSDVYRRLEAIEAKLEL